MTATVSAATGDQLFRNARTVRAFTDQEVPETVLEEAWDLAKWGPTAMNSLPLRLLVVRTGAAREQLAALMDPGNRERVLAAPVSLVVAWDSNFEQQLPVLSPHLAAMAAGLPSEIRDSLAHNGTFIQTGYLVVALRAVGLAVAPMNGMNAAAIDEQLLADTGWRSLLVINVGYADGDGEAYPRAPRLSLAEISRTV